MESIDYNVILQDYLEEVSRLRTEFVKTYSKVKENSQDVEKLKNRLELRENTLNKYYDTNGYEQSNPQELQQMGKVEREFRTALTRCEDSQNKLKQLKSLFELRLKVMDQEALTWDPALKTADPTVPDTSAADNIVKTHSTAGEKRKLSQAHVSPSISSVSRSRMNSTGRMPKRGSRTAQSRESRLGLSGASDRMKNGSTGLEGDESEDDDKIYCFCRRESFGDMIGCDGENCLYEWFHCECVGMSEPPIGQWYCPSCTQSLMNKND